MMALGYHFGQVVMMQLGSFQFGITTAAYQELNRASEWRWPTQGVFGKGEVLQFTGPGADTITLPGVIYPEWRGGFGQVADMRALAGRGQPLRLVDGTGATMGQWVIERVEEGQRVFADAGRARKMEFTLSLRRFPDEAVGLAALIGAAAGAIGASIPAGATGAVAQTKGLAASVATSAKSLSGTLAKAADQVQSAVAPYTAIARDALGGVLRAQAAVRELQDTANRALSLVGVSPIDVTALAGANNLATRAAGLLVSAESASALLRNSSARLGQISNVPASATRAMQGAQAAANSTVTLLRQTASEAGKVGG